MAITGRGGRFLAFVGVLSIAVLATPWPVAPAPYRSEIPNGDDTIAAGAADKAHNYTEAMRLWRKIDAEGDTALSNLPPTRPGRGADGWYHRGSLAIAESHLDNLSVAREKIGEYCEKGLGVRQDYSEAASWYLKAINTRAFGSGKAKENLGFLYAYGLGVPRDRAKARALWVERGPSEEILVRLLDNDMLPKNRADWDDFDVKAAIAKKEQEEQAAARRREAQAEAEAARRGSAAISPTTPGRQAQCWNSCSKAESECNGRNTNRQLGALFFGPNKLVTGMFGTPYDENCSQIFWSCRTACGR